MDRTAAPNNRRRFRAGTLAATVAAAAAVALPATASAGVTLVGPVAGTTITGPAIPFRVAVNQPGCHTNGSKGQVAIKVDADPNNVNTDGLGDFGWFSDGSPQVFEATAPYIGLVDGYGLYTVRAYLLCSDPNGGRIDVWSDPVQFTLAAPGTKPAPADPQPTPQPAPGPGQTPSPNPGTNDPVVPAPPAGGQQPGPGAQPPAQTTTRKARCTVPQLAGLTVKQAAVKLKKAGCKLGVVTPKRPGRGARVRYSDPKAGRRLPLGSKVHVVLAKGKKGKGGR